MNGKNSILVFVITYFLQIIITALLVSAFFNWKHDIASDRQVVEVTGKLVKRSDTLEARVSALENSVVMIRGQQLQFQAELTTDSLHLLMLRDASNIHAKSIQKLKSRISKIEKVEKEQEIVPLPYKD